MAFNLFKRNMSDADITQVEEEISCTLPLPIGTLHRRLTADAGSGGTVSLQQMLDHYGIAAGQAQTLWAEAREKWNCKWIQDHGDALDGEESAFVHLLKETVVDKTFSFQNMLWRALPAESKTVLSKAAQSKAAQSLPRKRKFTRETDPYENLLMNKTLQHLSEIQLIQELLYGDHPKFERMRKRHRDDLYSRFSNILHLYPPCPTVHSPSASPAVNTAAGGLEGGEPKGGVHGTQVIAPASSPASISASTSSASASEEHAHSASALSTGSLGPVEDDADSVSSRGSRSRSRASRSRSRSHDRRKSNGKQKSRSTNSRSGKKDRKDRKDRKERKDRKDKKVKPQSHTPSLSSSPITESA